MKTIKNLIALSMLLITFTSCKKEEDGIPSFSAVGYWTGTTSPISIGILNRENGTSRLYVLTDADTTTAAFKCDGIYKVNGDDFSFQSYPNDDGADFLMKTVHGRSGSMSGVLKIRNLPGNTLDSFYTVNK